VKMFDAGKSRMIGLSYGGKTDNMLSRFHLIPERYGQTDGQNCYVNIARHCARVMLTRDKNASTRVVNDATVMCCKYSAPDSGKLVTLVGAVCVQHSTDSRLIILLYHLFPRDDMQ